MTDQRALKILFDRYWSSTGWRPEAERTTSVDDIEYAMRARVMFAPLHIAHDDLVPRVRSAVHEISPSRVADAFLNSLATRRLDLRSALGSYAVFRHLPAHASVPRERCSTCGCFPLSEATDLNILSFERHKWAGVRHDQPEYALLDLELFLREPRAQATSEAVAIFRQLVAALRGAPPNTTSATLERQLAPLFRSNKAERDTVVAILGFCGILRTPANASYRTAFVSVGDRRLPDRRFVDMHYPACWWGAENGIDTPALTEYFGHVL